MRRMSGRDVLINARRAEKVKTRKNFAGSADEVLAEFASQSFLQD